MGFETAWLPHCAVGLDGRAMERRTDVAINKNSQCEERRMQDSLILVERRKGKLLLYGQVFLFLALAATLAWLIID